MVMKNRCASTMRAVESSVRGGWGGGRWVPSLYFDILCNNRILRIVAILFLDVFESSWQRISATYGLENRYTGLHAIDKIYRKHVPLFSDIYPSTYTRNILICSICCIMLLGWFMSSLKCENRNFGFTLVLHFVSTNAPLLVRINNVLCFFRRFTDSRFSQHIVSAVVLKIDALPFFFFCVFVFHFPVSLNCFASWMKKNQPYISFFLSFVRLLEH